MTLDQKESDLLMFAYVTSDERLSTAIERALLRPPFVVDHAIGAVLPLVSRSDFLTIKQLKENLGWRAETRRRSARRTGAVQGIKERLTQRKEAEN